MPNRITPWAFVLAVPDLQVTAAYFRDVLVFLVHWEEATEWRLAERDGVRVMLGHCPTDMPASAIGSHSLFGYIDIEDVDALHAELPARGAVCQAPLDQPYGMREMVVITIDGHRVVFAQQRC